MYKIVRCSKNVYEVDMVIRNFIGFLREVERKRGKKYSDITNFQN